MSSRKYSFSRSIALFCALALIPCFAVTRSFGQDKRIWQAGTIVDVKPHEAASGENQATGLYDVSVRVGKKIYVVLFDSKNGQDQAQYYVGMNRTVLVDGDTLKFNDLLGRTHSLPIVRSKDVSDEQPK